MPTVNFRNAVLIEDRIDCDVEHPVFGWIPTTLDKNDTFDNGAYDIPTLYQDIIDSGDYTVMPKEQIDARRGNIIRMHREAILAMHVDPIATNPYRLASLDEVQRSEFEAYRRALLDITQQNGFPNNVVWPTKPSFI